MPDSLVYRKEERLNTLSHAIGGVFALIGLFVLLERNSGKSVFATFSIVTYSITLISMFFVSAAYHFVSKVKLKKRLRVLDHVNIYFLIAGTYTPIALITLINASGWTIFYTVWGIAILGSAFKLCYTGRFEFVSLLLYVFMGWLIVLDFDNLLDYTSPFGLRMLFLGGAFYTFGILFYALEKIPFNHFIWHVFVLAGAVCHWVMICFYVI